MTTGKAVVKGIVLEVLSTFRGHKSIFVEDTTDTVERTRLAEKVAAMIKDGYTVFLIAEDKVTLRIKEYDAKTNEWVVYSTKVKTPQASKEQAKRGRKATTRVAADGTKTTAVARTAGG